MHIAILYHLALGTLTELHVQLDDRQCLSSIKYQKYKNIKHDIEHPKHKLTTSSYINTDLP